jgi:hypothetical protein
MQIVNGEQYQLRRTFAVEPVSMDGKPVATCEPPYYLFEEGTKVMVRHYALEVDSNGVVSDKAPLIRIETEDDRVIHVYRDELQ